jgi:hypothetical protein
MTIPTPANRDQAMRFLADTIPAEILANVRVQMQNKRTPWHLASHFGLGLQVRNAFRGEGFGWSDIYLDDHWWQLVEEAAEAVGR